MAATDIITGYVWEDCGATFLARIAGNSGLYITQATISAITCGVYDSSGQSVLAPSITVSSVVYDTLQRDDLWKIDGVPIDDLGYNFRHAMSASAFPSGNTTYTVQYKFDPASGEDFALQFRVTTMELLGS